MVWPTLGSRTAKEQNSPILLILTLKLVTMAMSLELEKEGQIGNLQSNTYHVVKIW